ncbi:DNA-binding response regulator, partial [bacterium J17]
MAEEAVKILIIDDEDTVRSSLADNLLYEGYQVVTANDGSKGIEQFKTESPDLVILDLMMPGIDGLEVCKQIRSEKAQTPIIMLTGKCSEVDKVVGLELGADDYLTKPFGMRELFARIKAVLRRSSAIAENNGELQPLEVLSFDDVEIDFRTYRATKADKEVALSAKEFELLKFLAGQPDVPVSRDQLLDNVWGYNN